MSPLAAGACPHCGAIHQTTCPRIRRIEYSEDGAVKAVELHVPGPSIFPEPIPPHQGEAWGPLSGPYSNE